MHSIRTLLGSRILQLREEQGLEVADAAVLIGCERSHLYSVERGRSYPSVELLLAIAKAYKVDEADLFVWPGKGPRHDAREQVRLATPTTLAALLRDLPAVSAMPIKEPDRRRGPRKAATKRSRPSSDTPAAGARRRPRRR
jgi:transcriptional regulator with XRE-family HTH domain